MFFRLVIFHTTKSVMTFHFVNQFFFIYIIKYVGGALQFPMNHLLQPRPNISLPPYQQNSVSNNEFILENAVYQHFYHFTLNTHIYIHIRITVILNVRY